MNDFLNYIWFDNTVRNYLIVAAIIVAAWLLNRFLAHNVANLIFPFIQKSWPAVERRTFKALIVRPLGSFLAILISLTALNVLTYPSILNVDFFGNSLKAILQGAGSIILIFTFIRLLIRVVEFIGIILQIKAARTMDMTDDQLIVFFKDLFRAILYVVGFLLILRVSFKYDISSVLTGLSILGAAIALAMKESLESLIASFIIFFDKPFSTGDTVKVQNITGAIEKVGLRSTRIRTDQKTFVTIPNKQMVDGVLDNLSRRTQRKAEWRFELEATTPLDKVKNFVEGVKSILQKNNIEHASVNFSDINSNGLIITVDFFTEVIPQDDFNALKMQINYSILQLLDTLGIENGNRSN